jgi:hypothetical protein
MATILEKPKKKVGPYSATELIAMRQHVYVRNIKSGQLRIVTPHGLFDLMTGNYAAGTTNTYEEYEPLAPKEQFTVEI